MDLTYHLPASIHNCTLQIESGLLKTDSWIRLIQPLGSRVAILCDDQVAIAHGNPLLHALRAHRLTADLFTFPHGELYKTRETKQQLEDQLLEAHCGRDTVLIAVGGGVTTDLGGFIAATFNRSLPLVMIPTSLMAMVDASIGGKNGVNVSQGKNLIGTIHQPHYVFIDTDMLKTLPERELRNGIVEMIKHALIADPEYFHFLQTHADAFLALDIPTVEKAIFDSCVIKKNIVEEDEKENGKRRLLNCGHTLAHALERLSHYKIAHGEAVAIGIAIEAHLSNKLGFLPKGDLEAIIELFQSYGLPVYPPASISFQDLLNTVIIDKKSVKGTARYVLLQKIGMPLEFDGEYCSPIDEGALHEIWNY